MKILIVARHFSPENTIGAIRLTKYAKYLARLGHEVSVYAMEPAITVRDAILAEDAAHLKKVYTLGNGRFYRAVHGFFAKRDKTQGGKTQAAAPAQPQKKSLRARVFECMYHIMWLWSDADFVRCYRSYTKGDETVYDVVFSSWNTAAAHKIAMDVLRRKKARYFVADFRDACVSPWPALTKNRDAKRLTDRVYRSASLVSVAFPSLLSDNRVPDSVPTAVLFNGFDPDDLPRIAETYPPDGLLHIAYCGQIYSGHQDFTPFFAALSALIDEHKIDPARIVIDYAGQSFGRFMAQAGTLSAAQCIENYGFVPRENALALEKRADMLLFAAWNSAAKPAIFPAKFPEYMMMGKPVLALVAGELPDSLPARVMAETQLGFCAEAVRGEAAAEGLREYLLTQYARFAANQPLRFTPNAQAVADFSYPKLSARLSERLEALIR